jgi:ParB/RepB/Spo0J family partition protein
MSKQFVENTSIPFNTIEVDEEFNCRTKYVDIDELAESIKNQGLITPLTVTKNGGEGYKLISGFRRWNALKMLHTGSKPVQVSVRAYENNQEMYLANLVENTARDTVHPADLARRLADLESGAYLGDTAEGEPKNEGIKRKVIAEHTSLSVSHINNLVRAHTKLCEPAKKVWVKKDVPMSKVFAWAKLEEEEQLEALRVWEEEQANDAADKASGKKKKKKGAAADDADGGAVSKKEIREYLADFQERAKDTSYSKEEKLEMKWKIQALRWVLGEIKRL